MKLRTLSMPLALPPSGAPPAYAAPPRRAVCAPWEGRRRHPARAGEGGGSRATGLVAENAFPAGQPSAGPQRVNMRALYVAIGGPLPWHWIVPESTLAAAAAGPGELMLIRPATGVHQ
jgi:hypothetical protein